MSVEEYISCTPRYTDAASSWLTRESEYAFSIWFNPGQNLSLEDLALMIETDWYSIRPKTCYYTLTIYIQRLFICGQGYSRQDLPKHRAAVVLKDRETFIVAWLARSNVQQANTTLTFMDIHTIRGSYERPTKGAGSCTIQ